jgi:hypothetical protein
MMTKKINTTILTVAFSDHNTVEIKLKGNQTPMQWGKGYWKLKTMLLHRKDVYNRFKQQWEVWKEKKKWYRDTGHWWGACVKPGIRRFFQTEGQEKIRHHIQQTNFYYECIYDLLHSAIQPADLHVKIKYYKAKITKLHSDKLQRVQVEL